MRPYQIRSTATLRLPHGIQSRDRIRRLHRWPGQLYRLRRLSQRRQILFQWRTTQLLQRRLKPFDTERRLPPLMKILSTRWLSQWRTTTTSSRLRPVCLRHPSSHPVSQAQDTLLLISEHPLCIPGFNGQRRYRTLDLPLLDFLAHLAPVFPLRQVLLHPQRRHHTHKPFQHLL